MKQETKDQAAIAGTLRRLGCIVVRIHCGTVQVRRGFMKNNEEGTPDLLVAGPGGSFAWSETKTDVGKLSAVQRRMHARLRRLGHEVYVTRSVEQAVDLARLLGCRVPRVKRATIPVERRRR